MTTRVGVDVGGTFSDFVFLSPHGLRTLKALTSNPQSGAIVDVMSEEEDNGSRWFVHGTTVATNTLLEETGAKVALITDVGFEDLVEIGRQKRPSLYDLAAERPEVFVARANRIGHRSNAETVARLKEIAPDAVAIGMLGSYRDASSEDSLAELVAGVLPGVPISVSSRVSPSYREYERLATTVLNAYLTPRVAGYLEELENGVAATRMFVMTSSGGLIPFSSARDRVGQLALSGPAGGVVASLALRDHHGLGAAISFDMGGTSTDVARLGGDGAMTSSAQQIGGRVNRVASMPIHTVGAGGGSIAWVDSGGALRVGPMSAGADPGPAAYGLGGQSPTVTDANVHLGYIYATSGVGTDLTVDRGLATVALSRLGKSLRMSADELARGILEVVDSHMERAIRRVSVEEGFDPRDSVLIAFGGAGGLHASRLARRLEMRSVVAPPHAGVFSAMGLLLARPQVEALQTVLLASDSPELPGLASALESEVSQRFTVTHGTHSVSVEMSVDARYQSQSHELQVDYRPSRVAADFASEHESRFGFRLNDREVEVVNIRAVATGSAPSTWDDLIDEPASEQESRAVSISGGQAEVDIWDRTTLPFGFSAHGPCLAVDETATIRIGSDESATVLEDGTLEISW